MCSCLGRITEALETVSRHRGGVFSRHALAQRHAEALQSCTHELDALVVDTTVSYNDSHMHGRESHVILKLAVTLEQTTRLSQLAELTRHVAAQQATFTKLAAAGVSDPARESRALLVTGLFFFLTPRFCDRRLAFRLAYMAQTNPDKLHPDFSACPASVTVQYGSLATFRVRKCDFYI